LWRWANAVCSKRGGVAVDACRCEEAARFEDAVGLGEGLIAVVSVG
jgi:hypothetical protein